MTEKIEDPIVQYYIVRSSARMSATQLCEQVANGTQAFMMEYAKMKKSIAIPAGGKPFLMVEVTEKWLDSGSCKIILNSSSSKKIFEEIKNEFDIFIKTDLDNKLLITWPMKKKKHPKIFSKLKLVGR